jgi:hypothetical protein
MPALGQPGCCPSFSSLRTSERRWAAGQRRRGGGGSPCPPHPPPPPPRRRRRRHPHPHGRLLLGWDWAPTPTRHVKTCVLQGKAGECGCRLRVPPLALSYANALNLLCRHAVETRIQIVGDKGSRSKRRYRVEAGDLQRGGGG